MNEVQPPQSALAPLDEEFAAAVIEGLSQAQKSLPCRYFYDARGSELFEEITDLDEYYPTRTELAILREHAGELARRVAPGGVLVEFGSGSSRKTEILLDAMPDLAAYVAIDVSESALEGARERLAARYPNLRVITRVGDFRMPLDLPTELADAPRLGFFPGSTIGNLVREEAVGLMRDMASTLGAQARLVIGVDLRKDVARLLAAYDDAKGVTAAFNLNLLTRINRELGADFDLSGFAHEAHFDPDESRIEMRLVSLWPQQVRILGRSFRFAPQERIHTENSHKYTVEDFLALARRAGWSPVALWRDPAHLFSVHELIAS
jgi:dimethylhistidine N-methyltransferase